MKTAQIILYHQLRVDYLYTKYTHFIYIHHTGKIKFQGRDLNLNPVSRIIDYAGGKYMIDQLQQQGKQADFIEAKNFFAGLIEYARQENIAKFVLVKPTEHYVFQNFLKVQKRLEQEGIELEFLPDTQSFFLSHEDFCTQYSKPPIMEYFYRFMRKKEHILMDADGKPEGGEWNYDKQNRKFDKKHQKSWDFSLEKNIYVREAEEKYLSGSSLPLDRGELSEGLRGAWFQPTNRDEALQLLDYFVAHHLDQFGALEDAMYEQDQYVHHSMLSTSINFGFLSPREVVARVAQADTAINNKEGFIRQILGWREYMYHFFHFYKDTLYQQNFFGHTRSLPRYFWKDPETCPVKPLRIALTQVHREYFCHHIQRLMIIGNFALLC
ncbi:cryptochrome/photolyase family protein, partial [Candidatus Gracilibacteria bacterium]|nr:cryptochrome/photolyase family protein [Candidatus Gracilibacteria bacterium]